MMLFLDKYEELFNAMTYIDDQIQQVIKDIPPVINQVNADILKTRTTANYNLWAAAIGIALGKLIQVKNILYFVNL